MSREICVGSQVAGERRGAIFRRAITQLAFVQDCGRRIHGTFRLLSLRLNWERSHIENVTKAPLTRHRCSLPAARGTSHMLKMTDVGRGAVRCSFGFSFRCSFRFLGFAAAAL